MAAVAKLTQTQVIKELAGATGTSTKVAKQFVTSFSDLAVRETKKSGVFVIPGIGRLVRVDRKARLGRNPATGEAIKIPAKKVLKFLMPSPKPFATSGIFLPPNSKTATTKMTRSSGRPIDLSIGPPSCYSFI